MSRLLGIRYLALFVLLAVCACARSARLVGESQNIYELRARELQGDVQSSLAAAKWSITQEGGTVARRIEGKYSIAMAIRYLDLGDQSAFSLDVTSSHTLDWLTFNNLGGGRLPAAIDAARAWLDSFRAAHAAGVVTPGSG